jgi:hypothetical protein
MELGKKPAIPGVPCPYTALLLATCWSVDLEPEPEGVYEGVYATGGSFCSCFLHAGMKSGGAGKQTKQSLPFILSTSRSPDNDDGVTVIDVTDPQSPAYCFVSVRGTQSQKKLPKRVPFSAEDYLRAYDPLPTPEEMEDTQTQQDEKYNLDAVAALEGEKMVTLEMLADAWPGEYKKKLKKMSLNQSPQPEQPQSSQPSLLYPT